MRAFKTRKAAGKPSQTSEDIGDVWKRYARKSKEATDILDLASSSFVKENTVLASAERDAAALLSTWLSVNLTVDKAGDLPSTRKLLRFVCSPSETGMSQLAKRQKESLRAVTSYRKSVGRDATVSVDCPDGCDPEVVCKLLNVITADYGVASLSEDGGDTKVSVNLTALTCFCNDASVSATCLAVSKLYREKLIEALVSTMSQHLATAEAERRTAADGDAGKVARLEAQVAKLESKCHALDVSCKKAEAAASAVEGDKRMRKKELDKIRAKAEEEGRQKAEAFVAEMEDQANRYYYECRSRDRQLRDCDKLIADLQSELDVLRSENNRLIESMGTVAEVSSSQSPSAASSVDVSSLDNLPESVADALDLAARAFAGRIAVTEKARTSAGSYDGRTDHDEAWQILKAIATVGYELCFESDGRNPDIAKEFQDRTGFELSLREKKSTKENSTFRKMRTVDYEGETLDITPHVKGKGKGNPIRVHFACDHDRNLMVIGWCGDHLETIGSRRHSVNR